MYAVIDTETTGLSHASDRIIELAIIGLDESGDVEWEWCTLLNPERDTGHGLAVRVHQIYASDVLEAPTFADCAAHVADLLGPRTLIGHHLRFDLQMLMAEFRRLGHEIAAPAGICTLELARRRGLYPADLSSCCDAFAIPMNGAHHALADARATVELCRRLLDFSEYMDRAHASKCGDVQPWPAIPPKDFTPVARPILPARTKAIRRQSSQTKGGKSRTQVPDIESLVLDPSCPDLTYLAAVETAIADRAISHEQALALRSLAMELELSDSQVTNVHLLFLRGLAGSMWADGEISAHERYDLGLTGGALGLDEAQVELAIQTPVDLELVSPTAALCQGDKVVFTGEMAISRAEWTRRAQEAGLRIVGSVSKRTRCVVVPYSETGSSKSRKARELGVEVVGEQRFARMLERLSTSAASERTSTTSQE